MRMRWLARLLLPRLLRLSETRPPDFQVVRGDIDPATGRPRVYLRRWWIIPRNRFCNIYLHNMLADDDDVLHDHMYVSLSLVLTNGIEERYTLDPERTHSLRQHGEDDPNWHRTIPAGQLVYRSSRMAHQLIVHQEAWTLFMTGPRIKQWGFWCPKGWRLWSDYVALDQDASVRGNGSTTSTIGRGCGEM